MYTTNVAADVLICVVGWLAFTLIAYHCYVNDSI